MFTPDVFLGKLAEEAKELRALDIGEADCVTDRALLAFADAGTPLEVLRLHHCVNVTGKNYLRLIA